MLSGWLFSAKTFWANLLALLSRHSLSESTSGTSGRQAKSGTFARKRQALYSAFDLISGINFVSGSKVTGAMNPAIPDSVESHGFSLSARIRHFPDADANRLPPRAGLGYSRIRWRRILCTDWLLGRIGRLGPRCAPERLPDRFHLASFMLFSMHYPRIT